MPHSRMVHIVDDNADLRRSIEKLLQSAGFSTVVYENAAALLGSAPSLTEGCILLDVHMPGLDGLAIHERLRERGVPPPVILMTGLGDIDTAVQAMKAGAVDFLEKPFSDERLISAIEAAMSSSAGPRTVPRSVRAAEKLALLSRREGEVLSALVAGHSHKEIAYELGISVRTVEVHRARMLRRLGVRHLAEAIKLFVVASQPIE